MTCRPDASGDKKLPTAGGIPWCLVFRPMACSRTAAGAGFRTRANHSHTYSNLKEDQIRATCGNEEKSHHHLAISQLALVNFLVCNISCSIILTSSASPGKLGHVEAAQQCYPVCGADNGSLVLDRKWGTLM